MEVIRKTQRTAEGQSQTSFEIPNSTITIGSIILVIVQTLATALASLLTNAPKSSFDKEVSLLKKRNFQVQLFQRVLEDSGATQRFNSIKLLIAAGIIDDPESKLSKFLSDSSIVPNWPKKNIEPLNTYIGGTVGPSGGVGGGTSPIVPDTLIKTQSESVAKDKTSQAKGNN